jgi:hypothetical protein
MIYSLDPFTYSPRGIGSLCAGCSPQNGLGVVYSLDPFAYSQRGMGSLGLDATRQAAMDKIVQGIVAKGDNCNDYLTWVDTYTRLSQKDKKKETLVAARELASLFQQKYNECVEKKATAAVQAALGTGTTPTPTPIPTTPIPTTPITPTLPVIATTTGIVPAAVTAAQNLLQQYAASQQGQAQAVASVPQPAPVQQPAPAGWMTPKTLLMIGGGVLAVGLVIYLMRRK